MIKRQVSVALIGGDKRQLYCAKKLTEDGFNVTLSGFEKLKNECDLSLSSPIKSAQNSDIIILPMPCIKNEKINAPFSSSDIFLDDALQGAIKGKKIFCGMKKALINVAPELNSAFLYDYAVREELLVKNASATAEGALGIAINEYSGTINGSRCLVCGYGRIGKALSYMLKSLNADVVVSARKEKDLAWISTLGMKAVKTSKLKSLMPFDIIFNTVPAMIFDEEVLLSIARNALVIDLASMPGGVDFQSASANGIVTIHALSLPGKLSPKTAGEIVGNTIINMLKEDDTGA